MIYNIINVRIHYPGKIPNLQADWRFLVLENCTYSSCHDSRNLPFYLHHQFSIGFWTPYKVLVWKLNPFFCVYHWRNLRRLGYFELWQVISIKMDCKYRCIGFMLNDNDVTHQALPGIVALCMKYHDLSGYASPPDLAVTCVKPSQTASEESGRMFSGGL